MYNNNFYPYQNYGINNSNALGRLSKLSTKAKFNWSNILNNTQKTLNIINQAIPVFYQIKPIYNNAKTIFKVINAVKEPPKININKIEKENNEQEKEVEKKPSNNNSPTFFL